MSGSSVYFDNNLYESETFTSSGNFSVPKGVNLVFIEIWGGGGGGGFAGSAGFLAEGGKPGGNYVGPVLVTPDSTVSVTIGSGGAQNTDGTDSIFSSFFGRGGKAGNIFLGTFSGVSGSDSFRALGGSGTGSSGGGSGFALNGGDAGYANGGDAVSGGTGLNGGIGAGGGAGSAGGGTGGNGICIIYWKKD